MSELEINLEFTQFCLFIEDIWGKREGYGLPGRKLVIQKEMATRFPNPKPNAHFTVNDKGDDS